MFSPICFTIFASNFFLFEQLKKKANCLNIGPKRFFIFQFAGWKKIVFGIREWWNHLMNSLLIENKSAKFLEREYLSYFI